MPGPGTSAGIAGSSAAPAGVPNGTTASRAARLHLGVRSKITRSYAHRAVRITGRLAERRGPADRGREAGSSATGQRVADFDSDRARADWPEWDICDDGAGWTHTDDRGRLPGVLHGRPLRSAGSDRGVGQRRRYGSMSARAARAPKARSHSAAGCSARSQLREWWSSCLSTIEVIGSHSAIQQTDSRGRFQVVYQFQGGVGRFPFRALVFGDQVRVPLHTRRKRGSRCHHELT